MPISFLSFSRPPWPVFFLLVFVLFVVFYEGLFIKVEQVQHSKKDITLSIRPDLQLKVTTPHDPYIPSDFILRLQAGSVDSMDNDLLLEHIRSRISGPSREPLNITSPGPHYSQAGQSQAVDDILGGLTDGFFVECGAAEGEFISNSLFFERSRNWTGLLIEANPNMYQKLLGKQRKAYSLNACLSPVPSPHMLYFRLAGFLGGIEKELGESEIPGERSVMQVQCYPLYSVMMALGIHHIHYFSLDVEGAELTILKTVPWDKLRIDVLTIEYATYSKLADVGRAKLVELRNFFDELGLYEEVGTLAPGKTLKPRQQSPSLGLDVIFKRKDLVDRTKNL